MHPALLENARVAIAVVLEVLVAVLTIRHRLYRRLPLFTIYVAMLVFAEFIRLGVRAHFGFGSPEHFWAYWVTQAFLMTARGAVVAEICFSMLGKYTGIWRLCRTVLYGVAGGLCVAAGYVAWHAQDSIIEFISTCGRGLEFAVLGTLLVAVCFTRYYRVQIERPIALVIAGLVFYAAVQVPNHEFLRVLMNEYYPIYAQMSVYSFLIAVCMWLVAVWKPVGAAAVEPILLDASIYRQVMPEMNLRLRELNSRLLEILR